jgi:hypothetical protein
MKMWHYSCAGAGLNFVGWYLSGQPIFQRGVAAVGCFATCLFMAWAAGLIYKIGYYTKNVGNIAQPPPTKNSLDSIDLRLMTCENELNSLKSRLSSVAIVAGIKPQKTG